MTFISGLIIGLFVGTALGVLLTCIISVACGGDE